MSYMALYRKWRPGEFDEVKGQEAIVTTLKNQIVHNRVGHAYLFCGTRGTGKTTIARLVAKAINCENPKDGSPCNECESCKAINANRSMNVVEIDAASNNGVDNIRQINNAVQYSPEGGKHLVYIIDEAHMLRTEAWNALLKTLEEPPEYAIFILATTDTHKIPVTILSRCQRYDFKRISLDVITDRLAELMEREGVQATREALAYVAKKADGSMRDALSILDQCIAFNLGSELTQEKVLETIGAVDIDIYVSLITAIKDKDISKAIGVIDDAVWQGKDLSQFINEFVGFIRDLIMLKLSPDMVVDMSSDNKNRLVAIGQEYSEDYLINYINILQEAANKIAYTNTKRVVLEVAIIKMCKPQMQNDYSAVEQRVKELEDTIESLEEKLASGNFVVRGSASPSSSGDLGNEDERLSSDDIKNNLVEKYGEASLQDIEALANGWVEVKKMLPNPTMRALGKATATPGLNSNTLVINIMQDERNHSITNDFFDGVTGEEKKQLIKKCLEEKIKKTIEIEFKKYKNIPSEKKEVARLDLEGFLNSHHVYDGETNKKIEINSSKDDEE